MNISNWKLKLQKITIQAESPAISQQQVYLPVYQKMAQPTHNPLPGQSDHLEYPGESIVNQTHCHNT